MSQTSGGRFETSVGELLTAYDVYAMPPIPGWPILSMLWLRMNAPNTNARPMATIMGRYDLLMASVYALMTPARMTSGRKGMTVVDWRTISNGASGAYLRRYSLR